MSVHLGKFGEPRPTSGVPLYGSMSSFGPAFCIRICSFGLMLLVVSTCTGQEKPPPLDLGKWFTISSNLDVGYRETQFFARHYNTSVFQWDSRVELWLPPAQKDQRWGLYLRVAGIAGSERGGRIPAGSEGNGVGMKIHETKESAAFGNTPALPARERLWRRSRALWQQLIEVGRRRPKSLRVCETLSLGDRRFVAVVAYEHSRFLLGGTSGSLVLLARLEDGADRATTPENNRLAQSSEEPRR
jgi:hypothetical protein